VSKVFFAPVRMIAGRLASVAGRRIVGRVWGLVGGGPPPRPGDRGAAWPRLLAALALEGLVFRTVSGAADQASRRWFARMTGRWPGEHRDETPGEKRA
jgi:hypothetical protein